MGLCGTSIRHCCWLGKFGKCKYVEESPVDGFYWRCSLRTELGSWEAVYLDSRYINDVKPCLDTYNIEDCGNWPPPGVTCSTCGSVG